MSLKALEHQYRAAFRLRANPIEVVGQVFLRHHHSSSCLIELLHDCTIRRFGQERSPRMTACGFYWRVSERGRLVIVIVRTHADVLHCGNNSHGRGGSQRRSLRVAAGCACHHEPRDSTRYRIERLLGQGGFGQVYLGTATRTISAVPEVVCIKASQRIDGWLREAYFGQLLDGHPRAIRVFDTFPADARPAAVLYCLALEYARHGDLSAFLAAARDGPRRAARREIAGILEVLGKLHRGQLLHRDLTPMNVFVCDGRRLKLGDFGIVRQQSDRAASPRAR